MFVTIYITVADYWRVNKDKVLKFYSIAERYEKYFEEFVLPEIGMLKLSEVTLSDIERISRKLYSEGKSKSIVSMVNALVRKLFHQAATEKLVNEQELKGLKPITWEKAERRVFSQEQEKKLLLSFQHTYQPELYTLCMFTGIPYLDLGRCKLDDYSREEKTLRVCRKPKEYFVKARSLTSKIRTIPLSEISCRVIEVAIKKQIDKNKNFPGQESEFIFTDPNNNNTLRIWPCEYEWVRKLSGIPDFRMKDLVSNFGIHALKQKVNPIVLKHYIGYKSDDSVNTFALSCHNNVKDIQASDDYYRGLINDE